MKRALFCAFLLFSGPLLAESLEEGFRAYEQNDFATAVKHWRVLATSGDATAQFNLGQMYRLGKGVPQDDREATKWYLQAARQGSRHALHNLRMMYQDGRIDQADLSALEEVDPGVIARIDASSSAAKKTSEKPATVTTTPAATTAAAASVPSAAPASAAEPEPEPEPEPVTASAPAASPAEKTAQPETAKPDGADWQDWLPLQNTRDYVVQVMASGAKSDILQYLKNRGHLLPQGRGYVRTRSRGQSWYVLLLGPYDDVAAARAAIKRLPDDLRKNKPWTRRVSAVAAIMR